MRHKSTVRVTSTTVTRHRHCTVRYGSRIGQLAAPIRVTLQQQQQQQRRQHGPKYLPGQSTVPYSTNHLTTYYSYREYPEGLRYSAQRTGNPRAPPEAEPRAGPEGCRSSGRVPQPRRVLPTSFRVCKVIPKYCGIPAIHGIDVLSRIGIYSTMSVDLISTVSLISEIRVWVIGFE